MPNRVEVSRTRPGGIKSTLLIPSGLALRAGLFLAFLVCSLAVFVFGSNYYPLFPTNGSALYAAILSAGLLGAAILFKRSPKLAVYRQITYAFFVAAAVNLVSSLFAGYNSTILGLFGAAPATNPGLALGKLYDTLLVVATILVLTKAAGATLSLLYLSKGNPNYRWGLGIGALVLANFFSSALIFFGSEYALPQLGSAILWAAVFAFCNSLLEELWVRGLFLKRLLPLIGAAGTVLLTSLWFGAMHLISVAYLPAAVIPVFVLNTFTMGVACAVLMLKTDSIWGAWLIHAAADLFLFIAVLAVHL